ncbi:hypothetical protein WJX81_008586 [Elliptochloris bilobata]|uniref:Thioredoxin domain-containing protein n=1 Tax=Elliptochloris bilobata TaxID=381761 RepID=A0AAW1RZY0_9CHLO
MNDPSTARRLLGSLRSAGFGRRAAGATQRAQAVQTPIKDVAVLERAIARSPADAVGVGSPAARRVAERAIEAAQLASFEEMVCSSDVTLVDFHATWCGPCQLMSKILAPIADEFKGQVNVVKVDTDQYPKLASRYNVKALPTLLLFREGRAVDRVEGVMAEALLAKRVRYYAGRMDKKFGRH